MPWKTLRRALDLLTSSAATPKHLGFYGGEPLLEFPLIRRAVEYLERSCPDDGGIRYSITTNGTRLTAEVAAFLATHRFRTHLSFDGVPAAQDLRGKGTFTRLDSVLDRIRADHPSFFRDHLRIVLTLTLDNLPYLEQSVEYFLCRDVREIEISPLITHPGGPTEGLPARLERQFRGVFRASLEHHRCSGRVPVALLRRPYARRSTTTASDWLCGLARGEDLTVDVDGRVYACVLLARSYQTLASDFLRREVAGLCFGNLARGQLRLEARSKSDVGEIFRGRQRKHSSFRECADCEHLPDCRICPVSIGHIPGNEDPHRVPDLQCALNLVALRYRKRMPPVATAADIVSGRAPVPEAIRKIVAFAEERRLRS
jgi:sulfatase maturation enzyme AslB (radical SAM superfamily)